MFKYTLVVTVLISVIVIAGFGMSASGQGGIGHTMSNCLFHVASGVNSMKLGEHIESWRGSVVGVVSFELPLFISFVLLMLFSISFALLNSWKIRLIQITKDIRGEPPKLYDYLNFFFSKGLLHPKIF